MGTPKLDEELVGNGGGGGGGGRGREMLQQINVPKVPHDIAASYVPPWLKQTDPTMHDSVGLQPGGGGIIGGGGGGTDAIHLQMTPACTHDSPDGQEPAQLLPTRPHPATGGGVGVVCSA